MIEIYRTPGVIRIDTKEGDIALFNSSYIASVFIEDEELTIEMTNNYVIKVKGKNIKHSLSSIQSLDNIHIYIDNEPDSKNEKKKNTIIEDITIFNLNEEE